MEKYYLHNSDVKNACEDVVKLIDGHFGRENEINVYPIPRGGVPATYVLLNAYDDVLPPRLNIVDSPEEADFFFDDIIDSGATMREYCEKYPQTPFFAVVDKTDVNCPCPDKWVVFPWEVKADGTDEGIENNVVRLLQFAGEDPNREGLKETPKRFAKAWKEYTSGYKMNPAKILKTFSDGAEGSDEMVVVADIPLYSMCEHHLATIFGRVTIGYIPNGKVVGLSKLKRLTDIFAKRLQVQERLTTQIADALVEHLGVAGCGVVVEARHMCMETRGVECGGHHTVTKAFRGLLKAKDSPDRAELLQTVNANQKAL